jgi:hypothetical protein
MARAEVVRELERIQIANQGVLRASDVVQEASHPGSPLHNHFEWDDTVAGHQWRLQQARQLIRVVVQMLPYDEPHFEVRAFVSLSPDRTVQDGGYRAMVEVLASPTQRQQLLADALAALDRLKVQFHQLSELDSVWRAAERARRNYGNAAPPAEPAENGDGAPA